MANFVAILPKLTGLANYSFQEIHIKSTLALIIYSGAIFTVNDMLNDLTLSQTTDVDKTIRRIFLGFQALTVLNSTLSNNLLMHSQPNTKAFWAYL